MVKHVALIIGCVILSFSAALIVPTSSSPIGENEQKEANLAESRSKRQLPGQTATATSSASSSSIAQNQLLTSLLPLLAKFQSPPKLNLGGLGLLGGGSNGLAGVLKGLSPELLALLDPILKTLGYTVGGLGSTLDGTLDGLGGGLGPLNPLLGGLGNVLEALLGGNSPKSAAGMPSVQPPILSAFPLLAVLNNQAKASSQSQSKATVTTTG